MKNEKAEHPFSGPKLHLFKKGQSKSSQMKQRNTKSVEKDQVIDPSTPNLIYSQHDANSYHGSVPQRQMSEGNICN